MQVSESELKTFLIDSGLVSRKEVDAAEVRGKDRGQSLGDILVSEGALSSDALRRTKAYVLGIPFVSLTDKKIPFEVLSLIPEPVARTRGIIAFKKGPTELEVAVLDTADLPAIDSVRAKTGLKILARLTDEESVKQALLHYQKALKEEFGDLIAAEASRIQPGGGEQGATELKRVAEELPTVRIVDTLLRHAIIQDASDVHIEQLEDSVLVRYRIDGALHDAMLLPRVAGPGIIARIKVLANLSLDNQTAPQDGRFKMETESSQVSVRASILPTYYGEKVVLRLLRETGEGFTLEALGFHGEGLERIHRATKAGSGLILVAGPALSGKTTTLYTLLDILNRPDASLSTIEDPIEYQLKRVNQTQVDIESGFTFANGLRALLRQDADVIMVGEIRDAETASLAVNAALADHLVLAAVPAGSAAAAIAELLDMGIEPAQLASVLKVVAAGRVVRRLCSTKEAGALSAGDRADTASETHFAAALAALSDEKLVTSGIKLENIPFYTPKASMECEDGYRGTAGIHEVLQVSPTIRDLILRDAPAAAIEAQARKEGMLTLLEDGIYAAARGITTLEEVSRART